MALSAARSTSDLHAPLSVAVIVGSTRPGRIGGTVADWFVGQAAPRGDMVLDVIDLVDVALPPALPVEPHPVVDAYVARLAHADAFVVVTPEYNHGYPASLKQAIDVAHAEWAAKPVGFVAYGGMAGGMRSVEQLRQVFPELHATTIRDVVGLQRRPRPVRRRGTPPPTRRRQRGGQDDARPARLVGPGTPQRPD